jgi:hypothetical protein
MATMDIDHSRDNESRVAEIYAVLSVGSVLTTLVVGLRTYSRAGILRMFDWDDGIMVFAQVLAIGSALIIGLGELPKHGHRLSERA